MTYIPAQSGEKDAVVPDLQPTVCWSNRLYKPPARMASDVTEQAQTKRVHHSCTCELARASLLVPEVMAAERRHDVGGMQTQVPPGRHGLGERWSAPSANGTEASCVWEGPEQSRRGQASSGK